MKLSKRIEVKVRVKVVKIRIGQGETIEDQNLTIGKEYDAWGYYPLDKNPSVYIKDDKGEDSALFHGEFEVLHANP